MAEMLRMELLARHALTSAHALGQRRGLLTIKKFTRPQVPAKSKVKTVAAVEDKDKTTDATPANVRLAKRIAMSGLCSRREAEKRIQSFDVTVNGHVVVDVGSTVDVRKDVVAVDGRVLATTQKVKVWMAHKMKGELVTSSDPKGRATIFDRLRTMGLTRHMMPVGRLDFNTEGLLLFTNDGDYARELEHPKTAVSRVYRALVRGNVAESKLQELQRGPLVDGIKYRPIKVTVQSTDKKDSWLQVKVTEGKNREVRKALAHVRLIVKQLIRVQYGPYRLADLPSGAVLEVRPKSLEKKQYRKRDDDTKR
ncbi:putative RNA pseudouridine synthase RP544 [Phytophthora citrophthora]|uniref:RNA pseudouridine synthase RP544 n=1 Tax=Phytophthora citrophthora TaxID=4793 RepID=A0AAD9G1G6_9STRA|nr:putative RNA pseudouridine synthase RP544 [Phytophthora citrophthora]